MARVDHFFFLIAGLAALVGITLGGFVLEGDYDLQVVHVHLLLFGWLSNVAYGLFYRGNVALSRTKVAWVHLVAAIIGTLGLSVGFLFYGDEEMIWLIWTGANSATLSAVLFLASVVRSFHLERGAQIVSESNDV